MAEIPLRNDVEGSRMVKDMVVEGEVATLNWSAHRFMGIRICFDIPGDQVDAALAPELDFVQEMEAAAGKPRAAR